MTAPILTRRIFLNAIEIQALEEHINHYRQKKRESDENGYLQEEYQYHNALKYLKGELSKFVLEQRFLKALLKNYKKPKVSKKHGIGESK